MNRWSSVALLACLIGGCSGSEPALRGRLVGADGLMGLELTVSIADTEYTRQEGLRLHGPLAHDEGLLLVFPTESTVCITNAGVPFPIDVIYLSEAGLVTATERQIEPDAPGPFCHAHTAMVLEVPGNTLGSDDYTRWELR